MTNRQIVWLLVAALCVVLAFPLMMAAQGQREGKGGGRGNAAPPENLQVLPKDWTRQQVVQVMQGFNMALGVGCNYCHVEQAGAQPNEKGVLPIDPAKDDKQQKKTARVMMRTVAQVNDSFGSQLGKAAGDVTRVQCVTCHRGSAIPKIQ